MRVRDILILAGLIIVILGLTVAEKYAQRNREEQRQEELAMKLESRRDQALESFRERWVDLSDSLRHTLDSMAQSLMASGVSEESLAVMVVEQPPETVYVEAEPEEIPVAEPELKPEPVPTPEPEEDVLDIPDTNAPAVDDGEVEPDADTESPAEAQADAEAQASDEEDDLARRVASEYHEALRALPSDLNAYERRVATNEVASLVRTRYNLETKRFDALLKRAAALED